MPAARHPPAVAPHGGQWPQRGLGNGKPFAQPPAHAHPHTRTHVPLSLHTTSRTYDRTSLPALGPRARARVQEHEVPEWMQLDAAKVARDGLGFVAADLGTAKRERKEVTYAAVNDKEYFEKLEAEAAVAAAAAAAAAAKRPKAVATAGPRPTLLFPRTRDCRLGGKPPF